MYIDIAILFFLNMLSYAESKEYFTRNLILTFVMCRTLFSFKP